MAKRNGWKLVDVRPNGDPILPKDCVFEGKLTVVKKLTIPNNYLFMLAAKVRFSVTMSGWRKI